MNMGEASHLTDHQGCVWLLSNEHQDCQSWFATQTHRLLNTSTLGAPPIPHPKPGFYMLIKTCNSLYLGIWILDYTAMQKYGIGKHKLEVRGS